MNIERQRTKPQARERVKEGKRERGKEGTRIGAGRGGGWGESPQCSERCGAEDVRERARPTDDDQPRRKNPTPERARRIVRNIKVQGRKSESRIRKGG